MQLLTKQTKSHGSLFCISAGKKWWLYVRLCWAEIQSDIWPKLFTFHGQVSPCFIPIKAVNASTYVQGINSCSLKWLSSCVLFHPLLSNHGTFWLEIFVSYSNLGLHCCPTLQEPRYRWDMMVCPVCFVNKEMQRQLCVAWIQKKVNIAGVYILC